ncbi:MAG: FcoT family thioesterase [Crocosphaera sp.]|nr:FcoT family thioesterase [Crocosphaera sp.]
MKISQRSVKIDNVNQSLLDIFLEPYKENCKYLKKAQFQEPELDHKSDCFSQARTFLWSIKADFAIAESCYIADTGHFNSVEFNICYNQLFYVMIAYLIQNKLIDEMKDWDLEIYKRRQLSDFLIVRFASTFKRPINSSNFQGTLSINKCSARGDLIMIKTSCAFCDDHNGWAEGDVTIAVLNSKSKNLIDTNRKTILA